MSLREYRRKRHFDQTPEPAGKVAARRHRDPIFVIQLHHASHRHYDFRLELDGVLKSWAVPKGPSLRPGEKRLAVQVEDHPLDYATFEGDIPAGHYGAGHVAIFDHGTWHCEGDPHRQLAEGKLVFTLDGEKLHGEWALVRTAMRGRQPQWLLIKHDDAYAADMEADDFLDEDATDERKSTAKRPTKRTAKHAAAAPPTRRAATKRARKSTATDWQASARALPGARAGMPFGFAPALTMLRPAPPSGEDWLHEIKWDGYRLLVDLENGKARLRSRADLDWTATFPEVARAIEALPVADACLDGELVALDDAGRSDFPALQHAIEQRATADLRYMLFDLPGLAGMDLRGCPLHERKRLLAELVATAGEGPLGYSEHLVGHGQELFAETRRQGLEGVVSKRIDSTYRSGRSGDWLKAKHAHTDEFVIVGYTPPKGSRTGFGSLLLAARDEKGGWRYVGRVGTGFDQATLDSLQRRLEALARKTPTVALPAKLPFPTRSVQWVTPRLVAEVDFRGWTRDRLLRQASFLRLREDKPADQLEPPEEIG
jgi:bifunctional non-homologous end joining protein LigD